MKKNYNDSVELIVSCSAPIYSEDAFVPNKDEDLMPPPSMIPVPKKGPKKGSVRDKRQEAFDKSFSYSKSNLSDKQKKKERKLFNKIIKPQGWSQVWDHKEQLEAGYELQYTEEDIKFGFPTLPKDAGKSMLALDSEIWNDELFDSERYQDWEDEWAEFDIHKDRVRIILFFITFAIPAIPNSSVHPFF